MLAVPNNAHASILDQSFLASDFGSENSPGINRPAKLSESFQENYDYKNFKLLTEDLPSSKIENFVLLEPKLITEVSKTNAFPERTPSPEPGQNFTIANRKIAF